MNLMTTCAHLMFGMIDPTRGMYTISEILAHWDNGCIELTEQLMAYAQPACDMAEAAVLVAGYDFAGVFAYDVSEEFGSWWGMEVLNTHGPGVVPAREVCMQRLRVLVADFFSDDTPETRAAIMEKLMEIK